MTNFDWRRKDVIKVLEEKCYDKQQFKKSNMSFEPYIPSKWLCNYDIKNYFIFYRMIMEKIRIKVAI